MGGVASSKSFAFGKLFLLFDKILKFWWPISYADLEWGGVANKSLFFRCAKMVLFCFSLSKASFRRLKQKSPLQSKRLLFVGVARFELTTSSSQTRRDTGLRYTPLYSRPKAQEFSVLKKESANIAIFYFLQKNINISPHGVFIAFVA